MIIMRRISFTASLIAVFSICLGAKFYSRTTSLVLQAAGIATRMMSIEQIIRMVNIILRFLLRRLSPGACPSYLSKMFG